MVEQFGRVADDREKDGAPRLESSLNRHHHEANLRQRGWKRLSIITNAHKGVD